MKQLLTIFIFILFASCASFKNPREIKEAQIDGLKYESLKRYDLLRLNKSLKPNDELALCHKGEYAKANALFKKKLDSNLKNYLYWNKISTCYILQKKYTQARKFLDLAMGTAKNTKQKAVVLNNIGVILLETQNFQEAKEYFKKSTELSKKFLTPKYNLTQIFLKFGLYKKASKHLSFLIRQRPQDIDFLNSKAHLELMQNNYKLALVYFNKIPKQYRSRDDIATNIAMTYFMLGLYEQAKKTLSNADKVDSFYMVSQLEINKKLDKKIGNR
ncbi:MAG: tetratricopeptide repeat protein [Halobacteriovoraceae bacterium]|jgi:tetratricopeptide (TPR) repeat protein|nr:tetratricopeptide repeat protein [Halobacteriovoraceae bacterium]